MSLLSGRVSSMKSKMRWWGVLLAAAAVFSAVGSVGAAAEDFSGYDRAAYESPISPTKKGMQDVGSIWFYEFSIGYETEFFPMEATKKGNMIYCDTALQSDGNPTGEKANVCNPWGETLYLLPGNREAQVSVNAVQTFEVPNDGRVVISPSTVVRHYGYEDTDRSPEQDIEVAVFVNSEQVWPQSGTWESVNNSLPVPNQLAVPALDIGELKKGDRVRFVIGCGNMKFFQWEDHSTWEVTVNVYTPAAETTASTTTTTASAGTAAVRSDATAATTDAASGTATRGSHDADVPKGEVSVWPWVVGGVGAAAALTVAVLLAVKFQRAHKA